MKGKGKGKSDQLFGKGTVAQTTRRSSHMRVQPDPAPAPADRFALSSACMDKQCRQCKQCKHKLGTSVWNSPRGIREAYLTYVPHTVCTAYVPDLSKPAPFCSRDEIVPDKVFLLQTPLRMVLGQKTASGDGRFQMDACLSENSNLRRGTELQGRIPHCRGPLPTTVKQTLSVLNCSVPWPAISRPHLASASPSPASQHVIGAEDDIQAITVIKLLCYGTRFCLSPRRRPP